MFVKFVGADAKSSRIGPDFVDGDEAVEAVEPRVFRRPLAMARPVNCWKSRAEFVFQIRHEKERSKRLLKKSKSSGAKIGASNSFAL